MCELCDELAVALRYLVMPTLSGLFVEESRSFWHCRYCDACGSDIHKIEHDGYCDIREGRELYQKYSRLKGKRK
jgi:hypothetical protein